MSFSPDINLYRFKHANIFAWHDYVARPGTVSEAYPSYTALVSFATPFEAAESGATNWAQEPMVFPTLETLNEFRVDFDGDGTVTSELFVALKTALGIDYLELELQAVMNNLPPIGPGSSKFLDWRYGFGFGFSSAAWGWKNGSAATPDEFVTRYSPEGGTLLFSGEMLNTNGYRSGETMDYIANDLNTTPYESFVVSRSLVATNSLSYTGEQSDTLQQVLYSTEVSSLNPAREQVLTSAGWAVPSETPTEIQIQRTQLPHTEKPQPKSEGFTGDLLLFRSIFSHYYESGYDYVRQDLKDRFNTSTKIVGQRDQYLEDRVKEYNDIIGATLFVPKGFRSKRQISPRALRETYTSFRSEQQTSTSTSTSLSMEMSSVSSGPSDGGSY